MPAGGRGTRNPVVNGSDETDIASEQKLALRFCLGRVCDVTPSLRILVSRYLNRGKLIVAPLVAADSHFTGLSGLPRAPMSQAGNDHESTTEMAQLDEDNLLPEKKSAVSEITWCPA